MNKITLQNGGYRAEFSPDFGGNCILLSHTSGAEILRSPQSEAALSATPLLYGIPVLLPPNRIGGGKCTFRGKEYKFPLNEPEHNNHCHGELFRTPFTLLQTTANSVTFGFESNEKNPYLGNANPFSIRYTSSVGTSGLRQSFVVNNLGEEELPFALAYHTTLRLAFLGGDPSDYALQMPAECEFLREMTHYIPTGEADTCFPEKEELRSGTFRPAENAITKFIKVSGPLATLTHLPTGKRVCYEASGLFPYRHIFNGGSKEFICVEPQTCRIDGLNVWGEEHADVIVIPPHETLTLNTALYLE